MGNCVLIGIADFDRGAAKLVTTVRLGSSLAARKGAEVFRDAWKEQILERAYDTGRFYRSIEIVQEGDSVLIETSAVNPKTGQPYPKYLEYGTRFMHARPTARPAFEGAKEAAVQAVGDEFSRLINEAFR